MPIDDDAIQLVVGGVSYQGWMSLDIDSDILTTADAFSFTSPIPEPGKALEPSDFFRVDTSAPPKDALDVLREGARCEVYIGNTRQMAGVIDSFECTVGRAESRAKISGRDSPRISPTMRPRRST